MTPPLKRKESRIAIIGAGAAGLATAWFLKQHGFENVTVFERHGRVGGLCLTLNEGYRSFDLGANYVTMAYRETLKIARAVGAETYRARSHTFVRLPNESENPDAARGQLEYTDMSALMREIRDKDGNPIRKDGRILHVGWIPFVWAILRFIRHRWRVRGAVDRPGLERIHEHPELCVSFGEWLQHNRLAELRSLFEIPITSMGYGDLDTIAAPYALKFMTLGTFIPMILRPIRFVGRLFPWPRRFVFGFQRLWEAVSWRLNVRTEVTIRRIRRHPEERPPPANDGPAPDAEHPIRIDLEYPVGIFNREERANTTLWFDHLVVATVRAHSLVGQLDIDEREHAAMAPVETYAFCMTTFDPQPGFKLPRPIMCVLPFRFEEDPRRNPPRPWAVVQLWADSTPMLQCYTRLPGTLIEAELSRDHLDKVMEGAEQLVERLGGKRAGSADPHEKRWEHYEQWAYFGHVSAEDMLGSTTADGETRKPYFAELEAMQGHRNTYWVGGATNFELVEVIVRSAKALVAKHFVGIA